MNLLKNRKKQYQSIIKLTVKTKYEQLISLKMKTVKNFAQKPLHLVSINSFGKLVLHYEAINYLKSLKSPLSILSIAGPYRTGKSFLLNSLIGSTQNLSKPNNDTNPIFEVGHTTNQTTHGLWIWSKPLLSYDENNQITNVIVMDSQGYASVQSTHDKRLITLALLLSTCFLYNSKGVIDKDSLFDLQFVIQVARLINLKQDIKKNSQQQRKSKCDFHWILRDFQLQLVNEIGHKITASEYMENSFLQAEQKVNQSTIQTLRHYFPQRSCHTLCHPNTNDQVLEQRPQFISAILGLKQEIFRKKMKSLQMSGQQFVQLVQSYVQAMNEGVQMQQVFQQGYDCRVRMQCLQKLAYKLKKLQTNIKYQQQIDSELVGIKSEIKQFYHQRMCSHKQIQALNAQVQEILGEYQQEIHQNIHTRSFINTSVRSTQRIDQNNKQTSVRCLLDRSRDKESSNLNGSRDKEYGNIDRSRDKQSVNMGKSRDKQSQNNSGKVRFLQKSRDKQSGNNLNISSNLNNLNNTNNSNNSNNNNYQTATNFNNPQSNTINQTNKHMLNIPRTTNRMARVSILCSQQQDRSFMIDQQSIDMGRTSRVVQRRSAEKQKVSIQVRQLNNKIQQLQVKLHRTQLQLSTAQGEVTHLKQQLQAVRHLLNQRQDQLNHLNEQNSQYKRNSNTKIQHLLQQLSQKQNQTKLLQSQIQKLTLLYTQKLEYLQQQLLQGDMNKQQDFAIQKSKYKQRVNELTQQIKQMKSKHQIQTQSVRDIFKQQQMKLKSFLNIGLQYDSINGKGVFKELQEILKMNQTLKQQLQQQKIMMNKINQELQTTKFKQSQKQDNFKQQLSTLQKRNIQNQSQLTQIYDSKLYSKDKQITQLQSKIKLLNQSVMNQNKRLIQSLKQMQSHYSEQKQDLSVLNNQLRNGCLQALQRVSGLKQEIEMKQKWIKELQEQKGQMNKRINQLKNIILDNQSKYKQLQKQYKYNVSQHGKQIQLIRFQQQQKLTQKDKYTQQVLTTNRQLQLQMDLLKHNNQQLTNNKIQAQQRIKLLEQDYHSLNEEMIRKQHQLQEIIEQKQQQIVILDKQRIFIHANLQQNQIQIKQLNQQKLKLNQQIVKLKEQVQGSKQQIDKLYQQHQQKQEQLQIFNNQKYQQLNQTYQQTIQQYESQSKQFTSTIQLVKRQNQLLKQKIQKIKKINKQLQQQNEQLQQQNKQLQQQNKQIQQQNEQLQNKLIQTQQQIKSLQIQHKSIQTQTNTKLTLLNQQLTLKQHQLQSLNQQHQYKYQQSQNQSNKTILQLKKDNEIKQNLIKQQQSQIQNNKQVMTTLQQQNQSISQKLSQQQYDKQILQMNLLQLQQLIRQQQIQSQNHITLYHHKLLSLKTNKVQLEKTLTNIKKQKQTIKQQLNITKSNYQNDFLLWNQKFNTMQSMLKQAGWTMKNQ